MYQEQANLLLQEVIQLEWERIPIEIINQYCEDI